MTQTDLIAQRQKQVQQESRVAYIIFAVSAAISVYAGWQEIVKYPVQVVVILISVYIYHFVRKNTYDTVIALLSAVLWCIAVLYFVSVLILPGIAAMSHITPFGAINDAAAAMSQLGRVLN